ncbi:MAG: hypothetical protein QW521_01710 [Desulfurococcaceae archaeon]
MKQLLALALLVLLTLIGCTKSIYLQQVSGVYIEITVDPEANLTIVNMQISLTYGNAVLVLRSVVEGAEKLYLLNAIDEKGTVLPFNVINATTFEVMVSNANTVNVTYIPLNAVEELGYGVYLITIDLEQYEGVIKSCITRIPRDYEALVTSVGRYSINKVNDVIEIHLLDPQLYNIVMFSSSIELPITPPTTGGNQVAPLLNKTPPALIAGLIAATAVVALIAIYFFKHKAFKDVVSIEEISPRDIVSDDVMKDIIYAIGRAGESGLPQVRLVKLLEKPKSTISRKLKRLSENNYIVIERSGKINIVKLTNKGWSIYKSLSSKGGAE